MEKKGGGRRKREIRIRKKKGIPPSGPHEIYMSSTNPVLLQRIKRREQRN